MQLNFSFYLLDDIICKSPVKRFAAYSLKTSRHTILYRW